MLIAGLLLSLLSLNFKDMSNLSNPTEIWKDIVGYETRYQISNSGKVKSLPMSMGAIKWKPEKIRLGSLHHTGYLIIKLRKDKIPKMYPIHRLLALAFIPNPENKPQVNHKDGDKLNNSLDNLEWVTQRENTIHAYKIGLAKSGANHKQSKSVRQFRGTDLIREWGSINEAQREFGRASTGNIVRCLKGKNKSAYGFTWEYAK